MGFNATRRYRDGKWADLGLLIVAALLIIGLIAWAVGLVG